MRPARLVAVALAALLATAGAVPAPVATIARDGALTVSLPPALLQSAEVRKHLTSGLTTAFVIAVSAGGKNGGARVSVRYELWEEEYRVTIIDVTGHEQKLTFPTSERLTEWWTAAAHTVMTGSRVDGRVHVTLQVLPFSAREQAETQRWLARVLSSMQSVKDEPVGRRSDPGAAKILDVIVGTSIRRRPILEHRWTVDVRREP